NAIMLFSAALYLSACGQSSSVTDKPVNKVLPEADSPGALILKTNCSQCHGAPNPNVHKADEWPNVVNRMELHRLRKAYAEIPKSDEQILIAYLQKYSAQ
ncbi:MAG: hypothetical protein R3240_01030, partial [Gammaproteobacteria bacterium]|nr:hypothetical protein [Gammaproteobacteria bacterium]